MKKVYGFKSLEEASKYADKNYMSGTYLVVETNSGNFAIEMNNII